MTEQEALRQLLHWREVLSALRTGNSEMCRLVCRRVQTAENQLECVRRGTQVITPIGQYRVNFIYDQTVAEDIEREIIALRVSLDEEARG